MPSPPQPLRVLMITSEWPTAERPHSVPFIVRQVAFLRRAGVSVDVFTFRGSRRPGNYIRAWRNLRARVGTPYNLIHAQWGQSGLLALPKVLPLVVTFRGDDLEGIIGADGRYSAVGRCLQLASYAVARAADEVVVVSDSLARRLPKRAFHIIPSGLDLEAFQPLPRAEARRALGLPEQTRLVLFAGAAQEPRKRYWLAQAAVERLASSETELVTATNVPHEQMPLYMNACDVLLLLSVHEGSPNVVKEALACDLPVVSTDVGDVRQRIGQIEGCAIVGDTPDEISMALEAVLKRGTRIAGRAVVEPLDERRLTQQLIAVYHQALGRSSGGNSYR